MVLVSLLTLFALSLVLPQDILAQLAYYHRLQDGRTMDRGQFFVEGYFDSRYARVPFASGGEHTESYNQLPADLQRLARTVNVGGRFTYALTNMMSLRVGVPVRYFEQQAWRYDVPGVDPHYGMTARFSFADIQFGAKVNLDRFLAISDNLNVALYGDLFLGTLGHRAISTGSNNIEFGLAANYGSLIVNLGQRINNGSYWRDHGQFLVNSNYRDLSKFDQERIGTRELLEQSAEDPIEKVDPIYFGLGYLKDFNNQFALFGEFESEPLQNRYMVKLGANFAITDSRILVLVPFVGAGLTPHSEQYMFGLNFIGREGMFDEGKIGARQEGFEYMPSFRQVREEEPVAAPPPREATQFRIVITGSIVNVRQSPANDATIITRANQGEIFDLIRETGNWYNVRMPDGEIGYVHNSLGMKIEFTVADRQRAQQEADRVVERQAEQVDIERERALIEQQRLSEQRRQEAQEAQERQQLTMQQQAEREEQRRLREEEERQKRAEQEAARRQVEALRRQQEEERRHQQVVAVENEKWKVRNITRERHVRDAVEDGKRGVTEAIRKLVTEGLSSERDDVRTASYNALVELGEKSIPFLAEGIRDGRYFVKRQVVFILAEIGHDDVVPILERGFGDRSISNDVVEALRKIPGSVSQAAYMRLIQMQQAEAKMDSIRRVEEARQRQLVESVGLKWGDTRNSLLTAAWRIAQYRRLPAPDANQQREYQTLRQVLNLLVTQYDEALGKGASLRLLKDNGYDESILR